MSYPYESLDDESFQKLVQALLVKEQPGVQCYPVGMPDGGRDATGWSNDGTGVVFQVKMSRNPDKISDPLAWISGIIDSEQAKVAELAANGYTRYRIICNLNASSHLDSGLMDKAQKLLSAAISEYGMRGDFWWRSDLDRRLDGDFDIKLKYPALLTGSDILRLVWQSGESLREVQRQQDAITAYMNAQYDEDHTVRFKQIELESTELFDLYIDVPCELHSIAGHAKVETAGVLERHMSLAMRRRYGGAFFELNINWEAAGAFDSFPGVAGSELLTDREIVEEDPLIVLEGAPGQGKTTLSQFVIQLQRCRLLSRQDDIDKLSDHHRNSPIRFPFKIELRDLSLWLRGIDPWSSDKENHSEPRSLEGALAAHVSRFSGGVKFEVADLRSLIEHFPIVIVLDALDEVANLDDRRKVIEAVTSAVSRLQPIAPSHFQLIVTSRPSAVASAPVFPHDRFTYLRLGALTTSLAMDYARKWTTARKLSPKAATAVISTMRQKLSTRHIAELSRNTMQLSILLSLVHVHSDSLPDRRTELYDEYTKLFFSREAEKSEIVRENRPKLVAIHRYLGYYLHARAESDRSNGRISETELKRVLKRYLTQNALDVALVEDLFLGVAERVVALVSRVEGSYEFEIQPLREYFAARHLYETAPYSPTGRGAKGTKPVRFDGIAANPYWLNVTRFYAGCFSDGELLDLAQRVVNLIKEPGEQYRAYPRNLATALLQDYVFDQSVYATELLAEALSDSAGLRLMSSQLREPWVSSAGDGALPPPSAGGDLIGRNAMKLAATFKSPAQIEDVVGLARHAASVETAVVLWRTSRISKSSGYSRIRLASALGIIETLGMAELDTALTSASGSALRADILTVLHNGARYHDLSPSMASLVIPALANDRSAALSMILMDKGKQSAQSYLALFSNLTRPGRWKRIGVRVIDETRRLVSDTMLIENKDQRVDGLPTHLQDWVDSVISTDPNAFATTLEPWRPFVAGIDRLAGAGSWIASEFAVYAAGIRSRIERGKGAASLCDENVDVLDRTRFARLKSGDLKYWQEQLAQAESCVGVVLNLAVIASVTLTKNEILVRLLPQIDSCIRRMDEASRNSLMEMAVSGDRQGSERQSEDLAMPANWRRSSPEIRAILLGRIFDPTVRLDLLESLAASSRIGPGIRTVLVRILVMRLLSSRSGAKIGRDEVERIAAIAKKVYARPTNADTQVYGHLQTFPRFVLQTCEQILADGWKYPSVVVQMAQTSVDTRRAAVTPIQDVADEQEWFAQAQ